jgi:hypothetical protein
MVKLVIRASTFWLSSTQRWLAFRAASLVKPAPRSDLNIKLILKPARQLVLLIVFSVDKSTCRCPSQGLVAPAAPAAVCWTRARRPENGGLLASLVTQQAKWWGCRPIARYGAGFQFGGDPYADPSSMSPGPAAAAPEPEWCSQLAGRWPGSEIFRGRRAQLQM